GAQDLQADDAAGGKVPCLVDMGRRAAADPIDKDVFPEQQPLAAAREEFACLEGGEPAPLQHGPDEILRIGTLVLQVVEFTQRLWRQQSTAAESGHHAGKSM